MTLNQAEYAELQELVELVCEQRIGEEQLARLQELVHSDPAALQFYVDYLDLHAQFMWRWRWNSAESPSDASSPSATGAQRGPELRIVSAYGGSDSALPDPAGPEPRVSSPSPAPPVLGTEEPSPPRAAPAMSPPVFGPDAPATGSSSGGAFGAFGGWGLTVGGATRGFLIGGAVVAVLLAGAGVYVQRMSSQLRDDLARLKQVQQDQRSGASGASDSATYAATLVSVTNCRWDKSRSTADFGSGGLRPGQSLHLVEGVAKMSTSVPGGGVAEFQLEGPLAMMLTSEGMPSLLYGRLTASYACDYDRFTLDTPLGRVVIPGDASIGVVAAANEVEVHVFDGAATFECWSNGLNVVPDAASAVSGDSLRARIGDDREIAIERGKARENGFVTPASLAASRLLISNEYVAAIRRANPIGYWRFESEEGGLVRNEMDDRLHCRVVGDAIRLHPGPGNRSAEFGATSGPGYFLSDDVIAEVADTYSVEAWIKPAYYHHALVFSLVMPKESLSNQHRFLIELCGPGPGQRTARPWEDHPNRLRFLHRGTGQCFSADPYAIRKWQHVAAAKDRTQMRLYIDGQLVASANDPRPVGTNLHVILGQLYPQDPDAKDEFASRLFVGELDEVALYDRALKEEEIHEHCQLARPEPPRTTAESY